MKFWLITAHSQYDPCGGTYDWHAAFTDEDEAREAFAGEESGDYRYLIEVRITDEGVRWVQVGYSP